MAFKEAGAQAKPQLACIGRVQEVGPAAVTKSGVYINVPVKLEGYGASTSIKTNLMFRTDWFRPGFSPESLKEVTASEENPKGGKALYFIYGKNIHQKGSLSTLKALVGGNDEKFDELASRIQALPNADSEDGPDAAEVVEVLNTYLVDEDNGNRVAYILGQQSTKTDEVDENGKPVYVLEPYYEVKEWGDGGEKWRERQYKRAEKGGGKFKVQFSESDVPF